MNLKLSINLNSISLDFSFNAVFPALSINLSTSSFTENDIQFSVFLAIARMFCQLFYDAHHIQPSCEI